MKGPKLLIIILVVLLLLTGGVVYSVFRSTFYSSNPGTQSGTGIEEQEELLPTVDPSVIVSVDSASKENTVVLSVKGMASTMKELEYELTYDSEGLIKGVNSGTKPIDVSGKDEFEREVYLGTCSRNVCKPDKGVTKVSVAMIFTGTDGKRSQFTQDYDL